MTKEEMLDYLENKRNLTVGVNNAAVAVNNAEHAREDMKFKYKAIYIGMVVVLPIMAVVTAYAPLFVGPLVVGLWEFAIPVIIVLRITSGRKTKKAIRDARNNLNAEYNRPEYVGGPIQVLFIYGNQQAYESHSGKQGCESPGSI